MKSVAVVGRCKVYLCLVSCKNIVYRVYITKVIQITSTYTQKSCHKTSITNLMLSSLSALLRLWGLRIRLRLRRRVFFYGYVHFLLFIFLFLEGIRPAEAGRDAGKRDSSDVVGDDLP